jgi:hypothetical protein
MKNWIDTLIIGALYTWAVGATVAGISVLVYFAFID